VETKTEHMDAAILQAVLPEIREELTGLPVTKVELVGTYGVFMRFGGSRKGLFFSAHPELSRLGLVDTPPALGDPRPAPDNLTQPLRGGRLVGVEQEPSGRLARFRFEIENARHPAPSLVAELIPRFANLILVGNDERILWSKRDFTGDRPRQIAAGLPYETPAADSGPAFADLDEPTIRARLDDGDGPLHSRLPRGWGGGPKGHARVFEEANLDVAERLAALALASRMPRPHVGHHEETESAHLFPADPGPIPGWTIEAAASANETVHRYYTRREEGESQTKLLADLRRILARRRTRAAKALRQIERRLDEASREPELRHQAELLSAHLTLARRGMKSVMVPEFDGSGDVEITLDPKLAPKENVDRLFRRARRLARGREESEAQRAIQESEVAEADRGLASLDPPPAPERLREIASELAPSVLAARERGARAPTAEPAESQRRPSLPPGFQPRVYELPGGWEVWVGRNSKQNDDLTHRHASPRDLWFHARGCQGSHTVLRVSSGKGEPSKDVILAAAAIAAFHSKARNSGLVPVAYTEKRFVRRARKAAPGTAVMMREKVVMVRPNVP
jgi:predicted ribosome quality control (RQC) complex YloA/Tae2 family protein